MPRTGQRLIRLSETPSTIDVARTLANEGAEHGTVVLANRQTAGRGRRGRTWTTIPDKSLAATIILRELPGGDYLGLAGMAAAVAVVHAVRHLGRPLQTKWPNDVVADGKKLAGTLAELHGDTLLLSLGLNINGTESDLPADIRETATTLELLLGRPLDREQVTNGVLAELDACWQTLLSSPAELAAEWETLDVTIGEEVVVTDAGGATVTGRALGIDPQGRLRLLTSEGEEEVRVHAGEVTLA
jgi:BirA family biotin operon repressor/biotin-[acetyl-CoA-carboxylase] ligase